MGGCGWSGGGCVEGEVKLYIVWCIGAFSTVCGLLEYKYLVGFLGRGGGGLVLDVLVGNRLLWLMGHVPSVSTGELFTPLQEFGVVLD